MSRPVRANAIKQRLKEGVTEKTRIIAYLTLLFSLAGYLSGLHRLLELTSHFKVQYLMVSVCSAVVLVLLRDRRGSLVAFLGVLLNSAVILPWYMSRPAVPPSPQASQLRLLLANVLTSNQESASLIRLVRLEKPDVLVLQEVDRRWMQELEPLSALYPYSEVKPRRDNFGIALLSRLPLVQSRTLILGNGAVPSILAHVDLAGQVVSILATHPLPPGSQETFE
jgi:endonuclease/exonuclease/phosphatase (EEP) superfamily protein YafD